MMQSLFSLFYRSLKPIRTLSQCVTFLCFCLFACVVQADEVKIYAAASLTDAITELSDVYQKAHAGVTIKKSFAGSSTLAKQIENGAPADIFISADISWVDYLQSRDLLDVTTRQKILKNELVLIAPKAQKIHVNFAANFNLAERFTGRLCTGDVTSVPVGKYAKQSLEYYNWWAALSNRIVGAEDVRTALAFVEREECSLGVVYKTDALLSKKVSVVGVFPAVSHAPIEYPGVLTKNASLEARSFWEFLQSKDAKIIFSRYGFTPIK